MSASSFWIGAKTNPLYATCFESLECRLSKKTYPLHHTIHIAAPAEVVWREVTHVDVTDFSVPSFFALLGVPKPNRSEILQAGAQGIRKAHFSNGKAIRQTITVWEPPYRYAFQFHPEPGFRVAYFLDLAKGPFQIEESVYIIEETSTGVMLTLQGRYTLRGFGRILLYPAINLTLNFMNRFLLKGIKSNAEKQVSSRGSKPVHTLTDKA